jgi:hypothetical protein
VLLGKKEEEIFKKNDERKRSHTKRDTEREKKKEVKRAHRPSSLRSFLSRAMLVRVRVRATIRRDQKQI